MEEQTRSTFGKSNWLTRLCAPIVAEIAKRCDSFVDSVEKLELDFRKRGTDGLMEGRAVFTRGKHACMIESGQCVPNDRQTASKSLDRRKVPFLRYDNIDRRPRLNYYVARRTRCA